MISSIFFPRSDFRIRMVQVQQSIQNTSNDRRGVGFCFNYSLDIQHLSIGMSRDYAMRREFVYITMLNHGIIWEKRSCTVSLFPEMIDDIVVFLSLSWKWQIISFHDAQVVDFSAKHLRFQIRSRPQYTSSIHKLQPPKLSTASIRVTRRSNHFTRLWMKKHLYSHQVIISSGLVVHWYIFERVPYSYITWHCVSGC